ncbi:ATP-dependent nuclease [Bifidobacterium cuniculi]|uniref:ATP-dependent endonuclease, OLD family protein n=1 Tax=Bifidobacterium cuniculi TaxID=1688 RepID=A0A087B4M0_9BIFI|nr:AAA family ATPase [Bifidobacterium cuniculi]KFI65970.1 ATP-dependent endonuclease, OLD family protein [Bifidobacterium cuniculi]
MRLTDLTIDNHTRVADCHLDIRRHLVLVGTNDSGKSSLLRCLDLLLGADTATLYADISAGDLRDPHQPLRIEATFTDLDPDRRTLFGLAGHATTMHVTLTATMHDDGQTLTIRRTIDGTDMTVPRLHAIGWTMFDPTDPDTTRHMTDRLLDDLDLDDLPRRLEPISTQADQALANTPQLNQLRDRIAEQLTAALPGRFQRNNLAFSVGNLLEHLTLELHRKGRPRNLWAQSSGMRTGVAITLLDALDRDTQLIGIDEPETHLHPASQRNLARLLAQGRSQKIIATHAPDIISAFDPDQVTVIRADGHCVQPDRDFLDDDARTMLHLWDGSRIEPLTANRVIVVEGVTDRILVERCADVTGRSLDASGTTLLQADGWGNMDAWRRLLGDHGYRIPMVQLIDADAADTTASQLHTTVDRLAEHHVHVSHPDLEGEYVHALGADTTWQALHEGNHFKPSELRTLDGLRDQGSLDEERVAAFCRTPRHKTAAILAILPFVDATVARRIGSIERLLADNADSRLG